MKTQIQNSWRKPARSWHTAFRLGAIPTFFFLVLSSAHAGSATWNADPPGNDWNRAENWTPATVPNGPTDIATFATSSVTSISLSARTEVDSIVFNSGASAYTITPASSITTALTLSGAGIVNQSGVMQSFISTTDLFRDVGAIYFTNTASAGDLTSFTTIGGLVVDANAAFIEFDDNSIAGTAAFTNNGGAAQTAGGGATLFLGSSSAGSGTFTNNGGTVTGAFGGTTYFGDTATAGNATLIANASSAGANGGMISFTGDSTGGSARVEIFGRGQLDLSLHDSPGVTVASIEGSGTIYLGARDLAISSTSETIFSGKIRDGGLGGGTGGSLSLTYFAGLTLTSANTYTGGTNLTSNGYLDVENRRGSATGSGPVRVIPTAGNSARLGGHGIIDGPVLIGTANAGHGTLIPATSHGLGTLVIRNHLTFNNVSDYFLDITPDGVVSNVSAHGVTILPNSYMTFFPQTTFPSGTVILAIDDTASKPIVGTFVNFPDKSVFVFSGHRYYVDYEGGDGNDLTFTVVR